MAPHGVGILWTRRGLVTVFLLVAAGGCGPPRAKYPAALSSDRPDHRIWAIRRAGERKDRKVIGILVDRLGDEDEAVRLYAILALERMTGTRLGYRYQASEAERARAIERWRAYLAGGAAEPRQEGDDLP